MEGVARGRGAGCSLASWQRRAGCCGRRSACPSWCPRLPCRPPGCVCGCCISKVLPTPTLFWTPLPFEINFPGLQVPLLLPSMAVTPHPGGAVVIRLCVCLRQPFNFSNFLKQSASSSSSPRCHHLLCAQHLSDPLEPAPFLPANAGRPGFDPGPRKIPQLGR